MLGSTARAARETTVCFALLVFALAWAAPAVPAGESAVRFAAQGAGPEAGEEERELRGWGQLGRQVRGEERFWEVKLLQRDRRGKFHPVEAYLLIPEKTGDGEDGDDGDGGADGGDAGRDARDAGDRPDELEIYRDRRVRFTSLEADETVTVFGKPVEREVASRGGVVGGKDRQIQNAQVVFCGAVEKLDLDEDYRSERLPGQRWLEGQVVQGGGGLGMKLAGQAHRLTLAKGAPVLRREKAERKRLRRGRFVRVHAFATDERPETRRRRRDDERPVWRVRRIVLLDKRYVTKAYLLAWGDRFTPRWKEGRSDG